MLNLAFGRLTPSGFSSVILKTSLSMNNEIFIAPEMSNRDFLEQHAREGRIGLAGGDTLVDRLIRRAERHVDSEAQWSLWSHAFIFQGERVDGHQWVIESDLQVFRKHISLGVQENRVSKYHDEAMYRNLAVLDFHLSADQTRALLVEALTLVAGHTRYSLRELIGTLIALRHPKLRGQDNWMAREKSFYCSAFVQHLFRKIDLDLSPDLEVKHTTPEDISRSTRPHSTFLLQRKTAAGRIDALRTRLQETRSRIKKRRGGSSDGQGD